MKTIENWMDENQMVINTDKCGIMCFPRKEEVEIEYKNEKIKHVNDYTYLGIKLDNDLSYETMARARIAIGWQTENCLRQL